MLIYNLLLELSSFEAANVTSKKLERAEGSKSKVPKRLLSDWQSGIYNEDPNILVDDLMQLVK